MQHSDSPRPFLLTAAAALDRGEDARLLFDENSPMRDELRRLVAAEDPGIALLRRWYEANAAGTVLVDDASYALVTATAQLLGEV